MGSPTGYGELRRTDLKGFDQRSQNIVLMAMERGGVGRISSKGHAILRSPNGQTMSVSRNTANGNRSSANMENDFRRCFGDLPVIENERTDGALALAPSLPEAQDLEPTLECPLNECEAVFVTDGARYDHVQKKHSPCPEPGCPKVFANKSKATGHHNIVHKAMSVHRRGEYPCGECDFVAVTQAGLNRHRGVKHKKVAKKAVKKVVAPRQRKVAPVLKKEAEHYDGVHAQEVLSKVSRLVAPDLVAQLETAHARIAELEAKLARIRQDLS